VSEPVRDNRCCFCGIDLNHQFENRCKDSDLFECRNRVKAEVERLKEKHEFYRQFLEVQEGETLFMAIEKLKDEHTRMKKLLDKESVI
jgi:hypothetical protein